MPWALVFVLAFWACCIWRLLERLEREYNLDLITTAPTVIYEVEKNNGDIVMVDNPSALPDIGVINEIREPIADVNILVPQDYLGNVISLCVEKRGVQKDMQFSVIRFQAMKFNE